MEESQTIVAKDIVIPTADRKVGFLEEPGFYHFENGQIITEQPGDPDPIRTGHLTAMHAAQLASMM